MDTTQAQIAAPKPKRPILRYHGGKWRLAPWIVGHFPAHRIYIEPFCGGANVLLRKPRAYSEVINDLDNDVVNLFRVLRDPSTAKDLTNSLTLTPYSRQEFNDAADRGDVDDVERARRYMVRCWMSYTGRISKGQGYRSNVSRSYTTPASDWAALPKSIELIVERLRGVVIESRPAIRIIEQYDRPDALFYCDPPYVRETRTSLRYKCEKAYSHEMTDTDHIEMAAALRAAAGMVVLSGYDCPLYQDLFHDWRRVDMATSASGQKGGVSRTESLWLSPLVTSPRRVFWFAQQESA